MNRRLIFIALLASTACIAGAQGSCFSATGPTPAELPAPFPAPTSTATPTPTPTPTPSPTRNPFEETCDFDTLDLFPKSVVVLAIGQKDVKLSLTPKQTITCEEADPRVECAGKPKGSKVLHEVVKACNVKREGSIIWASSFRGVSVGYGFEPDLTRNENGEATVTATLEGQVSNPVVVR